MSDGKRNDRISLSRRKILGATGTIGAAGLGAGFGASAFFSDQEQFANNQLTAGKLDMKVGWEEHYSDWSEDEAQVAHMDNGDVVVEVPSEFMRTTLQEQFPDKETKKQLNEGTADPCEVLADVPDDLEKPVIKLSDVKPGDFGEVTFNFTLCENPGHVWMNGELLENAENSVTEPEATDPDEDNESGDTDKLGELADAIQTTIWYDDNCDNRRWKPARCIEGRKKTTADDRGVCRVEIKSVTQCAKNRFGWQTGDEIWVQCCDRSMCPIGTEKPEVLWVGDPNDPGAFCKVALQAKPGPCQIPRDQNGNKKKIEKWDKPEGNWAPNEGSKPDDAEKPCLESKKVNKKLEVCTVEVTNVKPNQANCAVNKGDMLHLPCEDDDTPCPLWWFFRFRDNNGQVKKAPNEQGKTDIWIRGGNGEVCLVTVEKKQGCSKKQVNEVWEVEYNWNKVRELTAFNGTLTEALSTLAADHGLPLDGRPVTSYDEVTGGSPAEGANPNRECFDPETRHCIGFRWELPRDVGNEVQSDSVIFDLGFYTEQCRHNDGSGLEVNDEEVNA